MAKPSVTRSLAGLVDAILSGRPVPGMAPADSPGRITPQPPPLDTTASPGTEPRTTVLGTGWNLNVRPRGQTHGDSSGQSTLTSFQVLRNLANFDLCRIAVEDVKGQILGMKWDVAPRKGKEKASGSAAQVDKARAWLFMPDPLALMTWRTWASGVLEEILVTDALTLLPRYSLGGEFLGMEQVDGATIMPLVDVRGRSPLPPLPAFQQVVSGVPETEFTLGELLYLPSSKRPDSPYGRSRVENVLWTVNLAIRQNLHDLAFYTDGNVPDGGIFAVDQSWTPDQVAAYQRLWDELLRGNTDLRSGGLRFVPPGTFYATKDRAWVYDFQEWLARVIAWAFGTSPVPIAKQMNRATAETMESSGLESGVRPLADFLKDVLTGCMETYLDCPDVEFRWQEDETEDATVVYQRGLAQIGKGVRTVNEERAAAGLDPHPFETPPIIETPQGVMLLADLFAEGGSVPEPQPPTVFPPGFQPGGPGGQNVQSPGQEAETAQTTPPSPTRAGAPGKTPTPEPEQTGKGPPPNPSLAVQSDPGTDTAAADRAEKNWMNATRTYHELVRQELGLWRSAMVKRAKSGRPLKTFRTRYVLPKMKQSLDAALAVADGVPAVRAAFAGCAMPWLEATKGEPPVTQEQARLERMLFRLLKPWIRSYRDAFVQWGLDMLAQGVTGKADMPRMDPMPILDQLQDVLAASYMAGGSRAALVGGVELNLESPESIRYAQARGAELVGMKVVEGVLVPNPVTRWNITETVRAAVRENVQAALREGWSPDKLASVLEAHFEPWRAKMIARTETGFAYGNGAVAQYEAMDVTHLQVLDGDGCLPNGHQDGAPKADGKTVGVFANTEANNQIWTTADYQSAILGHPNCVRAAMPYLASTRVQPEQPEPPAPMPTPVAAAVQAMPAPQPLPTPSPSESAVPTGKAYKLETLEDVKAAMSDMGVQVVIPGERMLPKQILARAHGQGTAAVEVFAKARALGLPLPTEVRLVEGGTGGDGAYYIKGSKLRNTTSRLGIARERDMEPSAYHQWATQPDPNWFTNPTTEGLWTHELAHFQHLDTMPWAEYVTLSTTRLTPKTRAWIQQNISTYAQKNVKEVVAEIWSGVWGGKVFPQEVLDYYSRIPFAPPLPLHNAQSVVRLVQGA